ncbi:hypothetical protein TSAR_007364 [Trichomalopsis sarcophagae]|uniref:Protein regulator of cytokinesis 1 n=1 Tax=Trichomalopsis sarcophagae TaxID=543379 RepID=A0A232EPF3_9HYME|nr:hypothetical protein TSAR_007364 [Trichomalopsis sarcophagae]
MDSVRFVILLSKVIHTIFRASTIERAKEICEKDIGELFNIWEETGIKPEILNAYADTVLNHLLGLMKEMVNESVQKKMNLVKSVKAMAQAARKISKELGTNFVADSYDDLPLMELEIKLRQEVEELQQEKEKRLELVQKLTDREAEICQKLGNKPVGFKSKLPTEEEIDEFKSYIEIQKTEMVERTELFDNTRRLVLKMMEELGISPALDFEMMVCHDHGNFIYSQNNMTKLKDMKERLTNQVEHAKSQAQDKRESLITLWDYLDEPLEVRKAFLDTHSGYSLATINALNAEIKRCKEKRSENIANYVNKMRAEIESLWKLCKYGELQKKAFTAMKCQTYTEDLLTLHEMEADNLRGYYNANRKLFELLHEWEVQFEKLKELDQRANDPDRYHNRGGQLLAEEKERKAAEKKLPKLESQLHDLVDEYESIHKSNFLVHGFTLREFMDNAREKYEVEKENLKLARKQAKDRSAKKTPLSTSKRTPCASMLRMTPASNRLRTPGTNMSRVTPAAKRKLPYDKSPNTTENKKRAVGTAEKHKVISSKVRRSGRKPSMGKLKRKSRNDTSLSVSSYGNFQEHLDNRDELRSSVLPDEVLKRAGGKTPMKTPIKPVRRKIIANSTPANAVNSTRTLRGTPRSPRLLHTPRLIPIKSLSPTEF